MARQQANQGPHLFKYIIIGDTQVGKSSLMVMFTEQVFTEQHDMTIGVEFDSRSITLNDGSKAKLEIWDTAGQETYQAMTRAYYRGTDCCLLVYDVTRRETFEHLPTWLNEAKQNAGNPNLVLMLVANKTDLSRDRKVSPQEGKAFADAHAMLFVELSAREQKKVNTAFVESAQRVIAVKRANPRATGAVVQLNQPAKPAGLYDSIDCSCG